jgi:hypothetical protein
VSRGTGIRCSYPCGMGIHSEWAKVWNGEGSEFKVDAAPVQTVFIDGQIMLMKSQARCLWLPRRCARRVCTR